MKISIKDLKRLIHEALNEEKQKYDFGGSHPEEDYEVDLLSDPSYKKKSVYVPDDIKSKIDVWADNMGLRVSSKKRKGR